MRVVFSGGFRRSLVLLGAGLFTSLLITPIWAATGVQAKAEKIVMMLSIVGKEYQAGVAGGQLINADEYGESKVFLQQAHDRYQEISGEGADAAATAALESRFAGLTVSLENRLDPAEVSAALDALSAGLVAQFNLIIVKTPAAPVSLERGKAIYQENCLQCHGPAGQADGPKAAELDPAPAVLADPQFTGDEHTEPYDNFEIISVGIANTAMQAWADVLTEKERWDVTYYIRTFSNKEVQLPPLQAADAPARVAADIRENLAQSLRAYRSQDVTGARMAAIDAYLAFEGIEPAVINQDHALGKGLEKLFGGLQAQIKQELPQAQVEATVAAIDQGLGQALVLLREKMSFQSQFVNSLAIIVREGFEAMLIIAALITFLIKSKNPDKVKHIYWGVVVAIIASFFTAWLVEEVLQVSSAGREAMEGWILLAAVAMLFWVSYWLVSKVESAKWQAYITGKVKDAIGAGSSFTLGLVAFISVYREGFETILFYKALLINAGGAASGVWPGFVLGVGILILVYFLIKRLGVRIPVKLFFYGTSVFLAFMAFLFMGQGLHELQMAATLSLTPVAWAPEVGWLGMYATLETFIAQTSLAAIYVLGMTYTLAVNARQGKTLPVKARQV